jgi:hypothetical protein
MVHCEGRGCDANGAQGKRELVRKGGFARGSGAGDADDTQRVRGVFRRNGARELAQFTL